MQLNVNGKEYSVEVSGNTSFLATLREHLDLTGSKFGCVSMWRLHCFD